MVGILNLFRRMKKNRRLYVGNDSILAMQHIVSGYGECLRDFGIFQDEEFERFVRFVHDALKTEMSGISIWRLIAEAEICSCSAARRKLPQRATAMK